MEVLIEALDKRGAREGPLYNSLLRYGDALAKPGSPFRCAVSAKSQLYGELTLKLFQSCLPSSRQCTSTAIKALALTRLSLILLIDKDMEIHRHTSLSAITLLHDSTSKIKS